MQIRTVQATRILTPQKRGFLTQGKYPFTHSLSWAVGCGFGNTYCGDYCYAQTLPNWLYNRGGDEAWGEAVVLKENAPALLASELAKARNRAQMRIFMSSVTDPYQPLERRYRLTRQCLDVFAQFDDLDLLVIQTRSPLVSDDFDRLANVPYVYLSMTIETDRGDLDYGPSVSFIDKRFAAVEAATAAGIRTQITVSPCLPYSPEFAARLLASGADRIVVDTFVAGDGSSGARTAASPFAEVADYDWRSDDPAHQLFEALQGHHAVVEWSSGGFLGIPPRQQPLFESE